MAPAAAGRPLPEGAEPPTRHAARVADLPVPSTDDSDETATLERPCVGTRGCWVIIDAPWAVAAGCMDGPTTVLECV